MSTSMWEETRREPRENARLLAGRWLLLLISNAAAEIKSVFANIKMPLVFLLCKNLAIENVFTGGKTIPNVETSQGNN